MAPRGPIGGDWTAAEIEALSAAVRDDLPAMTGRISHLRIDPEIERAQRARTQALRASRDATTVEAAVAEVRRVADSDENLLPALREALAAGATVGELCGALRELWGTYDAH